MIENNMSKADKLSTKLFTGNLNEVDNLGMIVAEC